MTYKMFGSRSVMMILLSLGLPGAHQSRADEFLVGSSLTALEARLVMTDQRLERKPDRWERFQKEFSLREEPTPLALRPIASLKYGLDITIYTVDTFASQLDHALEFRYSRGRFGRAGAEGRGKSRLTRHQLLSLDDARFKIDCKLASGNPYIGVRLVLPFGD